MLFDYDTRGRLAGKISTVNGIDYALSRVYSPGGRVTNLTYPSGRAVDYTRNSKGQIGNISTTLSGATSIIASDFSYLPFGASSGWISGSGGGIHNEASSCGCLTTANPGTDKVKTFAYGGNNNLGSVTATNTPWHNKTYTYDVTNRLTEVQSPFGTFGFTYDKVGNVLTRSEKYSDPNLGMVEMGLELFGYVEGTNLLDHAGDMEITHDAKGATTSTGLFDYVYNQDGRLVMATKMQESQGIRTGVVAGEYAYNGLGQRVTKESYGVTIVFHYDFDGNIISESNESGGVAEDYIYMGMNRLAMADNASGEVYYYLNDQIGTPIMVTDDSGSVVWEAKYSPFGEATVNPLSSMVNRFRYPGQYFDAETGLHYNYHRYYDPRLGRYITADPIGLAGGINLFAYVQNNPVNAIDPWGLSPQDRVNWAWNQYYNNKKTWEGSWRTGYKHCNEFVRDAHVFGDPDATDYPSVLRNNNYPIPNVANLADPDFARSRLEYLPIKDAKPGDIVVWYGNGVHHSALFMGNDTVMYQHYSEGIKMNSTQNVTAIYGGITPIVRRYKY